MFYNKPTHLYTTPILTSLLYTKNVNSFNLPGFNVHTGKRNPLQLTGNEHYEKLSTQLTSCKLVHNRNKLFFPASNSSNTFVTIDYEAHINTKSDYPINHVFKTMSIAELNTLHTTCEVERTQLLTSIAMFVEKSKLAGFLLTQNRSNFLIVEGSTAWLYDCPHHLSLLYIADQCNDKIPANYLDTDMYVDPITHQTFEYANQIQCENNPQNVIALDCDQYYVLTPQLDKNILPNSFILLKFKPLLALTPNCPRSQTI